MDNISKLKGILPNKIILDAYKTYMPMLKELDKTLNSLVIKSQHMINRSKTFIKNSGIEDGYPDAVRILNAMLDDMEAKRVDNAIQELTGF